MNTPAHRGSRVEPFARLRVNVTANQTTIQFRPQCDARLAYLLVQTDDPAGLDACGITYRREGDNANLLLAAQNQQAEKVPPPLSLIVPPDHHRAEEYPGLFNDLMVGPNQAWQSMEIVIHVLDGAAPFTLDLFFFAYPC